MTQHLRIVNHLGLKLDALYDTPLAAAGSHPLVIMLHGNTGWKEEEHLASLAEELANLGIAALRFDTCGSGKSEGNWAEHYRPSNYLRDVDSVYDYAMINLNIDPGRVGIWGHSYGGMIAVFAAAAHPRRFRAVCGSQPGTGTMSEFRDHKKVEAWKRTGWANLPTEIFGTIKLPYAFYEDRSHFRTADAIKDVHQPILFIAGTKDKIISADTVRTIYQAANEPKEYLEFPAGHDYKRDPEALGRINLATVQFFQANLH